MTKGTVTGRTPSEPEIQYINRSARPRVKPEITFLTDFSETEKRVLAHLAEKDRSK